MKRLRVLVLSQYFWPEDFRVNDLTAELAARGHEVTVLTGLPNYPGGEVYPAFRANPGQFTSYAGASVIRVPLLPRGKGRLQLVLNYLSFVISGLLLAPWKLRGQQFDAIFVFQTSPITSVLPALLLRHLKRAPLLLWVLDLWPDTLAAVGVLTSPRALGWVGQLVKFIYRRCDRVLVTSRGFVANVRSHGAAPGGIRYFPNWTERVFEGLAQRLPDTTPAPELAAFADGFNIMFAGNIGDAQDFPAVLDTAELLRDELPALRWLIVGDGRAAEMLRSEVARRQLDDCFVLLGRHPAERMPSFFRGASAMLVSLRRDPVFSLTIPGKVQSYLSAGLPLLGMLDGEGARLIEQAGAGLAVPAGDATALAGAVRRIMAMPAADRAAMGLRGSEYAAREFGRARLMTALEGWMAELQPRGPGA
ncbi:MAG: glycosyltransferase family 4 protein [Rubrivivax sp.]|nr:glycosyltransferase family 4 protein [Rubrivivax sp.]MDP3083579.1 glycosyltransferase family 4 protein [Rubrivivax sp.]